MPKARTGSKGTLKRSFRRALVLEDISMKEFAAKHGVSQSHLYRVVVGERNSEKLMADVRALIAKHQPALSRVA